MRIIFKKDASAADIALVTNLARDLTGVSAGGKLETVDGRLALLISTNSHEIDPKSFSELECVERVDETSASYRLAGYGSDTGAGQRGRTVVEISGVHAKIGSGEFVVMAGPCAVEKEDDLRETAKFVFNCGAKILRGGAYKPRTSPYSFQGIGDEGLDMLKRVRDEVGIGIVTEAMEPSAIEKVAQVADIIQIGSRNMQNFPLLKEAGRQEKPVLLKRGMSATLEEWLGAAEYILIEGNPNVILCERGIRTFSRHSRHTLDLGVIPVLLERTHLPVVVDPSHATGSAKWVPSMAKASLAAGADGLLIEVHPEPSRALSDSQQALTFVEFEKLMGEISNISEGLGRKSILT